MAKATGVTVAWVHPEKLKKLDMRLASSKVVIQAMETELDAVGVHVRGNLNVLAPSKTGTLARSARYQIKGRGTKKMQLQISIGNAQRPEVVVKSVNFGSGIYGPTKRPIVPRRAKALSWIGNGGKRMFAKSVRGQRGQHFIERAWDRSAQVLRSARAKIGALIVDFITR